MAAHPDDALSIARRLVTSTPFDEMATQLRQHAETDPAYAPLFLALGAWACVIGDDLDEALNQIQRATASDRSQLDSSLSRGIDCLAMFIDAYRGASPIDHPLLAEILSAVTEPSEPMQNPLGRFAWLTETANWFTFADRYEDAASVLDRKLGLEDDDDDVDPAELISALCCRAELDLRRGRWRRAEHDLTTAIEISETHEHATGYARTLAARIAAGRDDHETSQQHLRLALAAAIDRGDHSTRWRVDAAHAFAATTTGDYETARSLLAPLAEDAERNAIRMASVRMWDGDYLEALIALDEKDEAKRHLKWIASEAEIVPTRWSRGILARGSAQIEDDASIALELAQHSVAAFDAGGALFEAARSRIVLAEALERSGRSWEAQRVRLTAARTFDAIGATPWRNRAEAFGQAAHAVSNTQVPPPTPRLEGLTPQEREIARCIASGDSNKEVAAELFISVKTVEAHLTRIYRKLDLRSRGELIAGYLGNTLD
ncbi:MAG: LuxR C-terminal-related transcriptional regulator [Acidimicrobiia bacterium]